MTEGSAHPPRVGRLRAIILTEVGILLTVALLALAVVLMIWLPSGLAPTTLLFSLGALIVADVALAILFGDHALKRLVITPVRDMAEQAERVANGAYDRRLKVQGPEELRSLAESVNLMADHLIHHQAALRANIESLDETNRKFSLARRELVETEKLATVGRVAAGIAHEVGNPLGGIMGYVEVAKRRGGADTDWVNGIEVEAKRIDRVIRGLLDFARPKKGTATEFEVQRTLQEVVDLMADQGHLDGIEAEVASRQSGLTFAGDLGQFEQILVNLLLNACDAVSAVDRPARITLRTERGPFKPPRQPAPRSRSGDPEGVDYSHLRGHRTRPSAADRFNEGDHVLRVEICDNGVGIRPDRLDRIFEPFFTTKAPGEGTGLGLSLAARMAETMGGALTVESEEDRGTCFTLTLPTSGAGESRADAPAGERE